MPDSAAPGTGAEVDIVDFTDRGERQETHHVHQIVKPEAAWKQELAPEEFAVTREAGTERAFTGRYWNNHEAGLYRCACCGTALFRSTEKFDSGTGWPSFWAPAAEENVRTQKDDSFFMERIEVLCTKCDAHLGHLFRTAPGPPASAIALTPPRSGSPKRDPAIQVPIRCRRRMLSRSAVLISMLAQRPRLSRTPSD